MKTLKKIKRPEPSKTRTDKDWVMIIIGILLILFFIIGGYLSLNPCEKSAGQRFRGPVKDPQKYGCFQEIKKLVYSLGVIKP